MAPAFGKTLVRRWQNLGKTLARRRQRRLEVSSDRRLLARNCLHMLTFSPVTVERFVRFIEVERVV
jgi:hypothetical protein